jgi:NADH-quinone oxidoreductase subunit N
MFVGNLLALLQENLKRLLAYSSIAHMGYLLVALMASGDRAPVAVACYLVAYFITMLGAFGVVTVLAASAGDAESLQAYRGLAWRRPWLAAALTAMLLSLAGIPLTAGFVGKFYVLWAGVGSGLRTAVVVMAINSAIGLYYYLRVMVALYRPASDEAAERPAAAPAPETPAVPLLGGVALAVLVLALVWLGVYPAPMIRVIEVMAAGLSSP